MALIQSTAIPSGATDYELEQSLRFNDDDSAYLSWTPSSAGNRKTWTFSAWIKRNNLGVGGVIFGAVGDNSRMRFSTDKIQWEFNNTQNWRLVTTQKFRDVSAWFHLLINVDTTQGTASNRMSMYINGVKVTAFDNEDYPDEDGEGGTNNNSLQSIGRDATNSDNYLDAYLAEVHFIDGTQLTPTSFGETGDYGEWKPIEYSGSYGTNGFYLNFAGGGIMSATGGDSTATDGDYKAASFTSDGTFTPSADGYVEYLVVGAGASGGGGWGGAGGGGGAGGYRTGYLPVTGGTAYSIVVGTGGAATNGGSSYSMGNAGGVSSFSSISSAGGGGGGREGSSGLNGASGGGGGHNGTSASSGGVGNTPSVSPVQGYNGGSTVGGSAGGGGSSAVGGNATTGSPEGQGGAGTANSITGSSVTYATGGDGGYRTSNSNGSANTGNGGSGGGVLSGGGSGGSGIVIIRYKFQ